VTDDLLAKLLVEALKTRPDLVEQARQQLAPKPALTVADGWRLYAGERGLEISSFRVVHAIHAKHFLPVFGDMPASSEMMRDRADEYVRQRRTEGVWSVKKAHEKQRRVSITTIRHEIATLKAMLQWLTVEKRLLRVNPLAGYKIKMVKEDLRTVQDRKFYLPEDGFAKLLQYAGVPFRWMFVLAYETGMRRAEFVQLEWSEVDLENAVIHLPAHRTKTRTARDIPLSDIALNVLRRQQIVSGHSKYVWPDPRGYRGDSPMGPQLVYYHFRKAREMAGIKGPRGQEIWIHTLRKSFGTLNAMRTSMPIRLQMELMGHTNEATHREYLEMGAVQVKEAREYLRQKRRGPQGTESPDETPVRLVKDDK
jgi:integrase